MRDIPTPHIVNVPVGVKLIGFTNPHPARQIINTPSSYMAIAQLLSNMIAISPFKPIAPSLSQYALDLPRTEMIGENEDSITLRTAAGYMVRASAEKWGAGR